MIAGDIAALVADRRHAAQDDVADPRFVQVGMAVADLVLVLVHIVTVMVVIILMVVDLEEIDLLVQGLIKEKLNLVVRTQKAKVPVKVIVW